jgi:hypothetical protein
MEEAERRIDSLKNAWEQLETKFSSDSRTYQRVYHRLDLAKETGIRLSCSYPGLVWELLIEAGASEDVLAIPFPKWKGMSFEVLVLDAPQKGTKHIALSVEEPENRDIFVNICADLISGLEGCTTNQARRNEISAFLIRWSAFFEKHGLEGLTPEKQRGLFGELWWLRKMVQSGIDPVQAVTSWKGCEQNYQDFELAGQAVEVKTSMMKEPRKVQISNERQLDNRGFHSLHLFVLTMITASSIGETLPSLIQSLKKSFSGKTATYSFKDALVKAGYLEAHTHLYQTGYSLIKEEFFEVRDGFPRITEIPQGLGDIHYALVLSACSDFLSDFSQYLSDLRSKDDE